MTDAGIMEAHANAALIKSGYDAFARGDVQCAGNCRIISALYGRGLASR
jgi:hypothetical protein